jgi:hypothetical protein
MVARKTSNPLGSEASMKPLLLSAHALKVWLASTHLPNEVVKEKKQLGLGYDSLPLSYEISTSQ